MSNLTKNCRDVNYRKNKKSIVLKDISYFWLNRTWRSVHSKKSLVCRVSSGILTIFSSCFLLQALSKNTFFWDEAAAGEAEVIIFVFDFFHNSLFFENLKFLKMLLKSWPKLSNPCSVPSATSWSHSSMYSCVHIAAARQRHTWSSLQPCGTIPSD